MFLASGLPPGSWPETGFEEIGRVSTDKSASREQPVRHCQGVYRTDNTARNSALCAVIVSFRGEFAEPIQFLPHAGCHSTSRGHFEHPGSLRRAVPSIHSFRERGDYDAGTDSVDPCTAVPDISLGRPEVQSFSCLCPTASRQTRCNRMRPPPSLLRMASHFGDFRGIFVIR